MRKLGMIFTATLMFAGSISFADGGAKQQQPPPPPQNEQYDPPPPQGPPPVANRCAYAAECGYDNYVYEDVLPDYNPEIYYYCDAYDFWSCGPRYYGGIYLYPYPRYYNNVGRGFVHQWYGRYFHGGHPRVYGHGGFYGGGPRNVMPFVRGRMGPRW